MQNDLRPDALRVSLEQPSDAHAVSQLSRLTGVCSDLSVERQKDYARIWVAGDSQVRGYLLCWWVADELQIVDVAVAPEARQKGVGSALLAAALADGKSHEKARAVLEVRAQNMPAVALYTKFGFQPSRRRAAYYSDGEDALEMAVSL